MKEPKLKEGVTMKIRWRKTLALALTLCLAALSGAFGLFVRNSSPTQSRASLTGMYWCDTCGADVDDATQPGHMVVTTFAQLITAWGTASCHKIVFENDILRPTGFTNTFGTARTAAVEVDGRGNKLNFYQANETGFTGTTNNTYAFNFGNPSSGNPLFYLHDVEVVAMHHSGITGYEGGGGPYRWQFKFGNLTYLSKYNGSSSNKNNLLAQFNAKIIFTGVCQVKVNDEIGQVNQIYVEPNSELYAVMGVRADGNGATANNSFFYMSRSSTAGSSCYLTNSDGSGGLGYFVIGDNAIVNFTNARKTDTRDRGMLWNQPANADVIVGEGATLYSNTLTNEGVHGNDNNNQWLRAKKNSTVIFINRSPTGGPALSIGYSQEGDNPSTGCGLEMAEGSKLFLITNNSNTGVQAGVVRMNNDAQMILNDLDTIDIRNDSTSVNARLFYARSTYANPRITITNSNIDLWYNGNTGATPRNMTDVPDDSFANVANFQLRPTNSGTASYACTSSNALLQSTYGNGSKYRRLSAYNGEPEVEFDEMLTDAHKHIKARVKVADLPKLEFSADDVGYITYTPIYAKQNQASVIFRIDDNSLDSYRNFSHNTELWTTPTPTNANGWALFPPLYNVSDSNTKLLSFLAAGAVVTAKAQRGGDLNLAGGFSNGVLGPEHSTTVQDITPPNPAAVAAVCEGNTTITGTGTPGAVVTVTLNCNGCASYRKCTHKILNSPSNPVSAVVDSGGNWTLTLPMSVTLVADDELQIFLNDKAIKEIWIYASDYWVERDEIGQLYVKGIDALPGSEITVTYNLDKQFWNPMMIDTDIDGFPVIVEENGSWIFCVPDDVAADWHNAHSEIVSVTATDQYGNENPVTDTAFADAAFAHGTIVIVQPLLLKLHTRQVILNPGNIDIRVMPYEGYLTFTDTDQNMSFHQFANSGVTPPDFSPMHILGVSTSRIVSSLKVANIVELKLAALPQYYELLGYAWSTDEHLLASTPTNFTQTLDLNVSSSREFWITVFIAPRPYNTVYFDTRAAESDFSIAQASSP